MQKPNKDLYLIKSTVTDGQLFIDLDVLDPVKGTKTIKCFGKSFSDDTLPESVKKNFKGIHNVHCILTENPAVCKVDLQKGVLTLVYEVTFPNGSKFQLQGTMELQQKQIPYQQQTKTGLQKQRQKQRQLKIQKLQQQVKKLQQNCISNSRKLDTNLKSSVKALGQDNEKLRNNFQQLRKWKNQVQIRFQQSILEKDTPKQKTKNIEISSKYFQQKSEQMVKMLNKKIDQIKHNFADKLQKQGEKNQDLKDVVNRHSKFIEKITQQNIQLKKTNKSLEQKITKMSQKNQQLQEKFQQLLQSYKNAINIINNHQSQIQNVKSEVTSSKKIIEQQNQRKIEAQKEKYGSNDPNDLFNLFFNLQPQQNLSSQSKKQSTKSTANLNQTFSSNQSPKQEEKVLALAQIMQIHPSSAYSKQFINNGKLISYNGVNQQPTQLIGKHKITSGRCNYIIVSKTKSNQIGFGVMISQYISQRNSIKKPYFIMYHGSNGGLYDGGGFINCNDTGFRQGDKVKMKVNTVDGSIQWSIGGIVVSKHKNQRIKDTKFEWFPFIRMSDRGDTIKWTIQ